jgi:uncharacterized membrane protein
MVPPVRKTWHEQHRDRLTMGQRVADFSARLIGSWPFIIAQTVFVAIWIVLNLVAWTRRWDPYPFILLNLMFSIQAAYAGPIIMMSQNRQAERDRWQAQADFDTNVKAEQEIEDTQASLVRIEAALKAVAAALNTDVAVLETASEGEERRPE